MIVIQVRVPREAVAGAIVKFSVIELGMQLFTLSVPTQAAPVWASLAPPLPTPLPPLRLCLPLPPSTWTPRATQGDAVQASHELTPNHRQLLRKCPPTPPPPLSPARPPGAPRPYAQSAPLRQVCP
jgi:hypothetical protein